MCTLSSKTKSCARSRQSGARRLSAGVENPVNVTALNGRGAACPRTFRDNVSLRRRRAESLPQHFHARFQWFRYSRRRYSVPARKVCSEVLLWGLSRRGPLACKISLFSEIVACSGAFPAEVMVYEISVACRKRPNREERVIPVMRRSRMGGTRISAQIAEWKYVACAPGIRLQRGR